MKPQILVVEDNPANSELLCDWLCGAGYDVFVAVDLAGAFSAVQLAQPHAVLLDVDLGGEDGLDFAQWMRQQPPLQHIPVIAVSAHAMMTEQTRMREAGCVVCISKPVDFQLLGETLDRFLSPVNAARCAERKGSGDANKSTRGG